ncbi:sensor histidine kinase [Acutalibacter muris]|uniref:sensor histidine kinase n=1 Tax=Acutalibacter muris TaxID=1796620 RepID=UPI0020CFDC2A|nr:GHKL domain-containing protein [Acutalibacter muris]
MESWVLSIIITFILLIFAGSIILCRRLTLNEALRRTERFQSDLLTRQVQEVENLYRQIRGMRHDLRNHAQTMQAYLQLGQTGQLEDYLTELSSSFEQVDDVLRTGNVMADAILNSKLSLCRSRGIEVNASAQVPAASNIPDVSLCTILGNLLDNALEACLRLPDQKERFMRVYIAPMKGQLYVSVTNSSPGRSRVEGGRYVSAKPGRDRFARHGFGLFQIDRAVKLCGGYVNRQQEEGVFSTEILLPL